MPTSVPTSKRLESVRHRKPMVVAKSLGIAAPLAMVAALLSAPTTAHAAPTCSLSDATVSCVFSYAGAAETWVVPPGVTEIDAQVLGAQGGDVGDFIFMMSRGGLGGSARATLPVTPGNLLLVTVGGAGGNVGACNDQTVGGAGGFNGGAGGGGGVETIYQVICEAGGGGGATDIRDGWFTLEDRMLIAGGGGGGAHFEGSNGGSGGGVYGGNSAAWDDSWWGSGGGPNRDISIPLGQGAPGKDADTSTAYIYTQPGGGGGGGLHGGRGGYMAYTTIDHYRLGMYDPPGGGGGGSGYGPSDVQFENGVRSGNGEATIRYPAVTVFGQSAEATETSVSLTAQVATNGRVGLPLDLRWGRSTDAIIFPGGEFFVGGPTTDTASAMISGLEPDTQYYYRFTVPGDEFATLQAPGSFRTSAISSGDDDGAGDGSDDADGTSSDDGGASGDGTDSDGGEGPGDGDSSGDGTDSGDVDGTDSDDGGGSEDGSSDDASDGNDSDAGEGPGGGNDSDDGDGSEGGDGSEDGDGSEGGDGSEDGDSTESDDGDGSEDRDSDNSVDGTDGADDGENTDSSGDDDSGAGDDADSQPSDDSGFGDGDDSGDGDSTDSEDSAGSDDGSNDGEGPGNGDSSDDDSSDGEATDSDDGDGLGDGDITIADDGDGGGDDGFGDGSDDHDSDASDDEESSDRTGGEVVPVPDSELTDGARGMVRVPDAAIRGEQITVQVGTGHAGEQLRVWFHSDPALLDTVTLNSAGNASVIIPENAALGDHKIVVQALDGSLIGWDTITIATPATPATPAQAVQSDEPLASTGSHLPFLPAAAAGVLLLLGIAVLTLTARVGPLNSSTMRASRPRAQWASSRTWL